MSEEQNNSGITGEIVLKAESGYALPENWHETVLPEDLRADPTLKNISDIPGMAKMLVNAQKMIGKDKVVIPGEGATEEQWGEFWNKLGRPESPDKYGLSMPEKIPPGLTPAPEMLKAFAETAHKVGLLPSQAKALADWYNQSVIAGFEKQANEQKMGIAQAEQKLREKFGSAYSERMELARRAFLTFAGEEKAQALNEKYGNDPDFIEFCASIAEQVSEDKLKGARAQAFTPTEAQATLNAILNDKNHPYFDRSKPGHTEAVKMVQKLNDAIYGTEPVAKYDVRVGG